MKNKVLVAMGIGISAAMVPAVATVADVIDPENLTQEQLDAQAVIQEAEATEEQEEVNFENDDDLLDSIEINLVPGAAPVQDGSVQAGEDGLTTPVHYADVTLNDNVEGEFHEFNTPSPTQMPLNPIVFIDPTATPTATATATIVPVRPAVGEAGSADFGMGLVPAVNPVDMNASGKADLMAEDLTNAGYLDVQVTKEEEKRVPLSQGLGNGNDPEPQLTKDQLVNTLITMKNVWGGFEDLIPYSDDALKAMTDEELVALNEQFKNIKIVQAVDDPEVKDTEEKVVLSGSFAKKEDRDSALINLRELGYACLKGLTDDDIAALSDEELIAMGIQATTTTKEDAISLEAQTGLKKAQLAEKLAALAGNAEKEDDQGYDVLTPDNIRKALKEKELLKDEDPVPAFEDMTDEQLLALSSKLGITRTTAPVNPDKTEDISDATRSALFTKLGDLKREGYEGLANVNLFTWINYSDEELVAAINAVEGLSDASYEVKNLVTVLSTDRLHQNKHNDGYEYVKLTLTKLDGSTYEQYLKVAKIGNSIVDEDGNEYIVGSKGLETETLKNISTTTYKVGNIYKDDDGNQFVITKITEVQKAVKKGDVITQDEYDKLTDAEKENFKYLGNYVWITKVSDGSITSQRTIPDDSTISIDNIEEYNVIALNSYSGGGSADGKVYTGSDENTNKYFAQYYEMLLETKNKNSSTYNSNSDINNGKNDTTIKLFCNGPEYTEDHNPSEYTTPVYYVTANNKSKVVTINLNTDNKDTEGNIIDAVFVVAKGIEKVIVNGINGVIIAPEADVYLANAGEKVAAFLGTVVGNNVINDGTYYAKEEITTKVKVKDEVRQYYATRYNYQQHKNIRVKVNYPTDDYEVISPAQYEDRGTGKYEYKEKEGTALTLNTGKIDIVGREVKKYEAKESKAAVYDAEKTSYVVNASRTLFDVTIADQTSVFSLEPETQAAKYLYGYTAPEQEATYKYGVEGEGVFYKYTVTGYKPTTISYYGEAVVTAPPVTPPPTDDDIITDTFVFTDAPADDAVAAPAPVAAVLGANRPVEVEGTVLGAIRSGSVLGERRAPGAVLGKRRSPKTADAAMGGMIAGMMLSMMTAFGGAKVLKKKREDGE